MAQSISSALREIIRLEAGNRCGYCQTRQEYIPWLLEIEHIIPIAMGGSHTQGILWLACRACNLFKATQVDVVDPVTGKRVSLYHPRTQRWSDHFGWSSDGTMIIGLTSTGRATVTALNLNHLAAITVRQNWVSAGWHPPHD